MPPQPAHSSLVMTTTTTTRSNDDPKRGASSRRTRRMTPPSSLSLSSSSSSSSSTSRRRAPQASLLLLSLLALSATPLGADAFGFSTLFPRGGGGGQATVDHGAEREGGGRRERSDVDDDDDDGDIARLLQSGNGTSLEGGGGGGGGAGTTADNGTGTGTPSPSEQPSYVGCVDPRVPKALIIRNRRTTVCLTVGPGGAWNSEGVTYQRFSFQPVADEYSVYSLPRSFSNFVINESFDYLLPNITVFASSGTGLSFLRRWYEQDKADLANGKVFPHLTAIIDVKDGVVSGITWDDSCIFCASSFCAESTYDFNGRSGSSLGLSDASSKACYLTYKDCNAIAKSGGTACDLTLYVVWTGTDANGNVMSSSNARFSAFQPQQIQDRWGQQIGDGISAVTDAVTDTIDTVQNTVNDAVDTVKDTVNNATEAVTDVADSLNPFGEGGEGRGAGAGADGTN